MALLKEHFRFGIVFGGTLYIAMFAIAFYAGLFQNLYTLSLSFISGFLAMIAGSLLPDVDAPRSPVHDILLVFFGSLVAVIMHKFSPLALLVAPPLSVWIDRNYLPPHRGFVHTAEAGITFGLLLSASLYFSLNRNIVFCIWTGFSLAIGHMLHLIKDETLRKP